MKRSSQAGPVAILMPDYLVSGEFYAKPSQEMHKQKRSRPRRDLSTQRTKASGGSGTQYA